MKENAPAARKRFFTAHSLSFMFWTALVLRMLVITLGHTYHFRTIQDHFGFGWEMGRVARALATGYGYADPFVGHTGPTAWVPPLYPLLLAGVFKLFGVYTALSAWVILTINSVFSAATAPFIYRIAQRFSGRKAAVWSAWIWVLYPAFMQYAVHWVWDMCLTAFLFAGVVALSLRMRDIGGPHDIVRENPKTTRQTAGQWALFGLLWGLIALSNPSVAIFLPVNGIWLLMGARPIGVGVRNAILSAVVCAAVLAPWTIRNYRVFHTFVPLRDNLGAELEAPNGPLSNGLEIRSATLPLVSTDPETLRYKSLGELRYSQLQGEKARAYIAAHPKHYLLISLKRFYFFWVSVPHPQGRHPAGEVLRVLNYCFWSIAAILGLLVALKRRMPAAGLFAWAFILMPLAYYFTVANARYRHPLEPLMVILTVVLFQSADRTRLWSWRSDSR